ncbi:orange carotenoid protein N-terminal domain-containing protein [Coleofasciculus sp. FACHB-1120]|uniref:orange carotenoid protein N-terminal domain-containing protein n=1 Tax=Coleofasciculus sp. FACHB-1120 TaxID=2692783 RepID=UPI0016874C3A|nr:orange carotenoid protein N-terminal domain-containing protein [Coleofasciculus sp. FACHB-1120]MBD2741994.1 Red carotenoid-binding protein [Coleofasciculus sp. FACHB-1120]
MTSSTTYTIESAQGIFPGTQIANAVPATTEAFDKLSVDDQLALLWFAYTEMGVSITRAATGAARMILAEGLLAQIKQMPSAAQTQVMQDIANRADTPISRSYSSFSVNTKLGFWYELGELMAQGIVAPIPSGYKMTPEAAAVLETIKKLDPGQQITVLRNTVINMGFDPALNDYAKPEDPYVTPTALASRPKISIDGISEPTVLNYIQNMNAFDFEAAVSLFAEKGALQPPFQKPIVGREAIFAYMCEECQGLKMMPQKGVSERIEDGYTQHKVTGKVETPWFGASVGMNIAWRFLLDPQGKIFFVAVDLLASPKELLNLTRQ